MTPAGHTADGTPVEAITLSAGELTVTFLTLGAILQSVRLAGVDHDLTLGSTDIADYERGGMHYFGAVVGPVANRFAGAQAPLGGEMRRFEANQDGKHLLHSGSVGTWGKIWRVAERRDDAVTFALDLPDGEGNFPGNRHLEARFEVRAPATLAMTLTATSDALTFMNMTNHSYWNLDGSEDWAGHRLRVDAERYMPVDADAAPTGEVREVAGTTFDFRTEKPLERDDPALDHNFCLSDGRRPLREVLRLEGASGVAMTMATTEPGMQVYDGRDGIRPGHGPFEGLAIEAQGWPDAPNHAGFPSIELAPGETYRAETEWTFTR
ncbi:putative aldose 1-epimerase protein [Oceanicola granulosus HTCC2516]|uniref:Aldose 1-epimerase n=1 Tax=Oceanicola granulosus (strain ATCC BAA-861 / DSM 15982 / KCTC 12143 / HTCC2516) TaxID=314256 RepID=Q2CB42_OCEGH|nr:aldose epimerase family protein [Oceanicola granulosus]EAR49888.1 putative aldose 1-epimerase protein [Oceanicola granulosus HTCC2516]